MEPHRRTRLLALPLLALVLPSLAGALHGQLGLEAAGVAEREGAAALVTGRVQRPDGTAASGAVVVSSLGGKAVTAPDGRFELALEVPPDAPAFHVTAVATLRGASHTATILVQSGSRGAPIDAGTVVLAASAGCTPSWIPTFAGMPGVDGSINALTVFDDGGGPALYAGGDFTIAGGVAASHIAKWDGSSWSPLGSGMNLAVWALTVFDDGGGRALYAGGPFTSSPGGDSYVAKWSCPVIASVPGCAGNPAVLAALAPSAPLGAPLPLQVTGSAALSGLALVYAGAPGVDARGCGLLVPGLGELLLALAPPPLLVANQGLAGGTSLLSPFVPSNPSLAGLTVYLHGLAVDLALPKPIELTNALAVKLGP